MNKNLLLLSCLVLIFAACTDQPTTEVNDHSVAYNPENYFTPDGNRTTAEWEPAMGTQVTWPLCVPHNLLVELSNDNHLYTLVENEESQKEAEMWFQKWGIELDAVTFLHAPQGVDAWWTRDWGPHGVFNSEGVLQLGDPKYLYATPMAKAFCSD
jgi:agmatine deiminase